jgi:cytochrome c oxidase assembly factor CtaG
MPARRFLLALSVAVAAAALAPTAAYAHEGHDRPLTLTAWTWDPTVILGLVALLGLYLYGLGRLPDSERAEVSPWRVALFLGGLATVFLALESPLDLAGDEYLFTFHMLQHQLLMMVAAPLLLLGTPPALLHRLLKGRAVRPVAEVVTSAPVAFLAFNATVWAWHAPDLYQAALRNENIHILQHLTFLATAVLFWWPVIGLAPAARVGRGLSIGGRMAYLGLAIVSDASLGFIIGFWPDVLYPFYEEADRLWGLSALADQQIGAAVMGAIDSAVFFLVLSVLFFALLEEEERRATAGTGN